MPLPRPDVHRKNITLYFEYTGAWGRGDNVLWSNILIIRLSSLFPPLPPFADPEPPPSLVQCLLLLLSHSLSSLLDRGMAEIIIMF